MRYIPLTMGKSTIVDDDIFDVLGHLKWHGHPKHGGNYYAARLIKKDSGKYKRVYLHHCVAGFPLNGLQIDHVDRNSLNNLRDNLRIVTNCENTGNQKKPKTSKYVGVFKQKNKWVAQINIDRKQKYLGSFNSEEEARNKYLEVLNSSSNCLS